MHLQPRSQVSPSVRRVSVALRIAALAVCLAGLCACGSIVTPTPQVVERITLSGPAELMPVVREMAESFAAGRRAVQVEASVATSAEAIAGLQRGAVSVAVVAAPLNSGQTVWRQTEIARQPIAIIVHGDNPVKSLSLDRLGDIYSGRVTDWRDLGGPASPIMVLSREAGSSQRLRVDAAFIGDGRLTGSALLLTTDEAMLATVARRPEAIGYVSGSGSSPGVRALVVQGEQTSAVVSGKAYPLWQPIILVTAGQPTTQVLALLSYARGRQGQRIVSAWGYGQGGSLP